MANGKVRNPNLPLLNPVHSDLVWQSYGVCAHSNFGTGVYSDTNAWIDRFVSLDARYFRSMYAKRLPSTKVTTERARAEGFKWLATITPPDWSQPPEELNKRLMHIRDNAADVVIAIEGTNEPNESRTSTPPPPDWPQRCVKVQKQIWDFVQAEMPHISVVGPSLHATVETAHEDHMRLGELDIQNYFDYAGLHRYFGGVTRTTWWTNVLGGFRKRSVRTASFPTWVSETGYRNTVAGKPTAPGTVTDAVSAKYGPLCALEFFTRGCKSTRYELLDDPDSTYVAVEAHTGLWACPQTGEASWTEKPEAQTMRDFLAAMKDPGPSYSPPSVRLGITLPAGVKQLIIGKRNGSADLLLWQNKGIYDPVKHTPITVDPISVELKRPRKNMTVSVPGGELVTVPLRDI